ncbi:MAG TPA: tetratricopeptide repeat protein, partial [Methylomirabilota bacterium]|nr:tetratricopeptide repeat protein [Methylomirabilota bacterium]
MSIKVFYCYAREDKALRATLEKHLGNLKRQELITGWSDRNIDAGKEWAKEIDCNLNTANVILLLISPDFMHSDYCCGKEMIHALERHENGTAKVIPIILRPVEYEGAPFSRLQALPTDAVPVTDRKWRTRDEAFLDIAQGIRKVVKELLSEQWVYDGNIHFYREQFEEALKAFERAISLDHANALAFLGQGETLCQLISQQTSPFLDDRNQKALTAFEQAISLDTTNARAYVGKGKSLFNLADPFFEEPEKGQMLEALEQAIRLDPKNAEAYLIMGDAFMALGRYKEAVSAYQRAIEVAPFFNRLAYKGKGNALYNLERYEEALIAY